MVITGRDDGQVERLMRRRRSKGDKKKKEGKK